MANDRQITYINFRFGWGRSLLARGILFLTLKNGGVKMATKLDYQEGLKDWYQGKPGRSADLEYIIGWKQGWIDRLWEQKGGKV